MQAVKVGWAGQVFALASSNDSGGKKTRVRRSKEERKLIAESFIKKYQNLNDGNFPSLNLTHKEVGGSFYTVREIVREIIQENRVLAPPKVSQEEHGLSGLLEQHPLGSISMEPTVDLSVSDRGDVITHIAPNEIQFSSAENDTAFSESYKLAEQNGGSDRTSESYHVPSHYREKSMEEVSNSPQTKSHNNLEENIVKGFVVADHNKNTDEGQGSQMLSNEQYHVKNEHTVFKDKEFGERIYNEPTAINTLNQEKLEAQTVESSPSFNSHTNSDIVVETFPLRPVPTTIDKMAGESGKQQEAAETLEDKGMWQEKKTFTQSSSSFVSKKTDENRHPDSAVEVNGENRDAKVVLNLQGPSMENAKPNELDTGSIGELVSKVLLPDGAQASSSSKTLISEDSTAVVGKSRDRNDNSVAKGNNPTLDRINLETWDRAARKSPQPESNPLLAFVKSIISSFVKFWTE
ncbi:hypothetical protein SASPL_125423 [Salvia splendens]|uniref:AT3G52170-like helix-turn-helix domain-containing protein n=1 Tax=Salvia splendens TaxID=180675 RepID=A0A8X8ZPU5_SALSN|nr:uncharacterized protein LOC121746945 [Salvia splendens]XP_041996843.1 uncharacterized protein LOC121746945 [Salvia splendens]XP_041996844.1 uncharacterized protein LOC121746945 [Salvia splendens]XP_041996845.1 uncharacterized protein LOC121746945 [Salvia splendens]XP_041996846.1 uncharacterized protein LOC121746945 [Salvia splendens]KAG6412737.1 hypothetical protein SASPL_125423 [Salvia splendens]